MNSTTQPNTIGSLNSVKINKESLLSIIQDNKKKHDEIYEEACVNFQKEKENYTLKVRESLEKSIEDLWSRFNKAVDEYNPNSHEYFSFNHQLTFKPNYPSFPSEPVSYEKEYNKAIRKVELEVSDTIALSPKEFESLVLNEWEWREQFETCNTKYLSGAKSL